MASIIVTGVSRGIGEALAAALLERGHRVVGISRSGNAALRSHAEYREIAADLGDSAALERLLRQALELSGPSARTEGIGLVNNAAVLRPLRGAESSSPAEIAYHLQANLAAPVVLCALFARHTELWTCDKRILNVTSASAEILLPGMSCYCTAKAGLDVFTRTMGLEQQAKAHPIRVASVWPGMIETSMQAEAREQPAAAFPGRDVFVAAKEDGLLSTAAHTAGRLADLLFSNAYPQGEVVRNLEGFSSR